MSYDIYIGEAVARANEEGQIEARVIAHSMREAPTFDGDEMTCNGNHRHPGYSAWEDWCDAVDLRTPFFDDETGLMRRHPGTFSFGRDHLATVTRPDKRSADGMAASMVGLYQVRRAKGDTLLAAYGGSPYFANRKSQRERNVIPIDSAPREINFLTGEDTSRAREMRRRNRFHILAEPSDRASERDAEQRRALEVDDMCHAVGAKLTILFNRHRVPQGRQFPERACMLLANEFTAHLWLNEATFRAGVRDAARVQAMCITLKVSDASTLIGAVARHGGAFGRALRAWAIEE